MMPTDPLSLTQQRKPETGWLRGVLQMILGVAFITILPGPAGAAGETSMMPGVTAPRRLPPPVLRQITQLVSSPLHATGHVGIVIQALGTASQSGEVPHPYISGQRPLLYLHNANQGFMPASNLKLFTAAQVMRRLSLQTQFTTVLEIPPAGRWTLQGGGDPSLDAAGLNELAARVAAAGIRRCPGVQVGPAKFQAETFQGRFPFGWIMDDALWYYGPAVSDLAFHRNQVDVRLTAGRQPGDPVSVSLTEPVPGFTAVQNLESRVVTGSALLKGIPVDDLIAVSQLPATETAPAGRILLTGSLPPGAQEDLGLAVPDPRAWACHALQQILTDRGITAGESAPEVAAPRSFAVQSPPLQVLMRRLLKQSDNLYAEMLLRASIPVSSQPGWNAPHAAEGDLLRWLQEPGHPALYLKMHDGSGLSRYDLVSPRTVAALLARAMEAPWGGTLLDCLPVAGVDGTLKHRMTQAPAAGNVRAKTGTFSIASNLSGYVRTRDGHVLAVVVLTNFLPDTERAHRFQDAIFGMISASRLSPAKPGY